MRKFYSFVLLAATLLLSTNIWAGNVAKITNTAAGTQVGEYATMAKALEAWTDGTTLTMLEDATYTGEQTYEIDGTRTLDLGGKSLQWQYTSDATSCIVMLVTGNVTIKGGSIDATISTPKCNYPYFIKEDGNGTQSAVALNIENVSINVDFAAAKKYGYVVRVSEKEQGSLALSNTKLVMAGKWKCGIYIENKNIARCENVEIKVLSNTYLDNGAVVIGVYSDGHSLVELTNTQVDLSSIDIDRKVRTYPVQAASSSKIIIKSGTFVCNAYKKSSSVESRSVEISGDNATVSIDGGKFSKQPTAGKGTLSIPDGKMFAKMGDFYELVSTGLVGIVESSTACATFEELWNACPDNKQTSVILLNAGKQEQITIPANKNILLSIGLPEQEYNITNNGSVTLNSTLHGSFTNAGAGTLSVIGGTFAETEYNAFVKDNVPTGYGIYLPALNSTESYSVRKDGSFPAKVGNDESGYVAYSTLKGALLASSATYPAIVMSDCNFIPAKDNDKVVVNNGKKYVVDLNGHTVKIDLPGLSIEGGEMTFKGKGTLEHNTDQVMELLGSTSSSAKEYSVLTIESSVVVKATHKEVYAISVPNGSADKPYGIVVNFNGTYDGGGYYEAIPFYINGITEGEGDNMPIFNIGETATITNAHSLAYAAGYGIWNYAGKATVAHHGFEIRAGKLNMTGGSIICTADKPADDMFNGNGSTSQACAIGACQHDTKLPISVVINGGELTAYTPIYQANPQNNPQEDIDKVSVVVNNAKVYSTSQNIVWSANKKVVLNGGVYNLSPAAYVASGKAVVDNTDADTKALYPYAIGAKATAMTTVKAGAWNDAATWSAEAGATAIPTAATPVAIKHAVTIPAATKAQTDGITVEGGNITVEGALIVGNAGITGITAADQLLIKDGASMVISPAAPAGNSQPLATVELKTVIRDVKDEYPDDRTYEYIWQNIGVPVTPMTITPAKTLTVNTWDIVSAWVPATEFGTPFLGYHVTNVDNKTAGMIYTFAGKLVGPQNAALSMPRDGFHFFGNSWTAPFDVKEILNQLQSKSASDDINSAVYVYISDKLTVDKVTYNDGQYVDINLAKLEDAATAEAFGQIAAMQGFFLHSDAKADIALNYEKAVWNAALAKPQPTKKPASMMEEENTAVRLILTAENGRSDVLYLYEGEAYAAPKMMNTKPNVNIYAITADGNYSTMGVDKIEGSKIGIQTNAKTNYTISFDWLKGETLYLKDKTANKYVAMLEDATYSFTAEANATIDDRFEIVGKSDVPGTGTAVEDVNVDVEATGIYTLMGQYVGETSMWNTLPAGMYIVNGKKCVK